MCRHQRLLGLGEETSTGFPVYDLVNSIISVVADAHRTPQPTASMKVESYGLSGEEQPSNAARVKEFAETSKIEGNIGINQSIKSG